MTRRSLAISFALVLAVSAGAVEARCYADYKAKQDDPLRLHYGVIELPDAACADPRRAAEEIARRIARDGWSLLDVLATFGDEGLGQRQQSAGDYYLRY